MQPGLAFTQLALRVNSVSVDVGRLKTATVRYVT